MRNLLLTGLAGAFAWKFRDRIGTRVRTLGDFALLFRESMRKTV